MELEFLTQALEKAVRVRKGISKAGEKDKAPSLKSESIATSANKASTAVRASKSKPLKGTCQTMVHAKGLPDRRLLAMGDHSCMGRGAQAAKTGPGPREQQTFPSVAPQATEAFTLKEKG